MYVKYMNIVASYAILSTYLVLTVFCYLQTPLGGIHLPETKKKFLEGSLHPANVLMCPHTCVTNLPKPREHRPGKNHMYPCII